MNTQKTKVIAMGTAHTRTPMYISDLPGHVGLVRVKAGSGITADWGWSNSIHAAIALSPYWQRRFVKYARESSTGRGGRLLEVRIREVRV